MQHKYLKMNSKAIEQARELIAEAEGTVQYHEAALQLAQLKLTAVQRLLVDLTQE